MNDMAAAARFMFDEDFATGDKPTITVVEAERRRADAESVAHRQGFEQGQAQVRGEQNERIARALTTMAEQMSRLDAQLTAIEARLESEAVHVAFAVAIMWCGPDSSSNPIDKDGFLFRLTVGLRKVDGSWRIAHEHHSVPATD